MKTLSRRKLFAAVPALAATPALAALVPFLDEPLDMTPARAYWDRIAVGIERAWHKGQMPELIALFRAEDGLDDFADALEYMWRERKLPMSVTATPKAARLENFVGEGGSHLIYVVSKLILHPGFWPPQ